MCIIENIKSYSQNRRYNFKPLEKCFSRPSSRSAISLWAWPQAKRPLTCWADLLRACWGRLTRHGLDTSQQTVERMSSVETTVETVWTGLRPEKNSGSNWIQTHHLCDSGLLFILISDSLSFFPVHTYELFQWFISYQSIIARTKQFKYFQERMISRYFTIWYRKINLLSTRAGDGKTHLRRVIKLFFFIAAKADVKSTSSNRSWSELKQLL